MLAERKPLFALAALGLLAFTIFLVLSLVTFHPSDPPTSLVYPPGVEIHNACGRVGAFVASCLFEAVGLGAYYLAASLGTVAALLLSGRAIDDRWVRLAGWGLSLVGLTTVSAQVLGPLSPGPAIGAGGYLGAAGRAALEIHFASAGACILAVSVTLGGLLLSTDYVLVRLSALLVVTPARGVGWTVRRIRRKHLALDDAAAAKGRGKSAAGGVPLRVRGKLAVDDLDKAPFDSSDAADPHAATRTAAAGGLVESTPSKSSEEPRIRVRKNGDERSQVMDQLDAASRADEPADYQLPGIDLLLKSEPFAFDEQEKEVRRKAKILEKTFANFGFNVKVVEIESGPVIAQFEVELEAGLRLSKITSLADDLAIALRVPSVRIVAPIPGKNTVGIEVPNAERQLVRLREVIEEAGPKANKMRIPIFLGKDVSGSPLLVDLTTLPHLLIAGRTGTGKSVCLNTIIVSLLMTRRPDEVRMLLIDPKMVELSPYKRLPHLMHPVVTDMRKAEAILAWAVDKMEERYALLARAGVRHIAGFNQLGEEELMDRLQPESDEERQSIPTHLPYIVIVADEMADLMMTSAKEVETHIIRLAQKSRAVGIHLVLATQKPTVDVITGLIKSNLPARIAFQVASRTDSRVVLDEMGADKLLGNGDLLFLWPGTSTLLRGQGTYVSDDEINGVVDFVGTTEPEFVSELVQLKAASPAEGETKGFKHRDELYEAAVDLVVREGRGSVSLLQRALGIGYGRGARLIDFMAEDGIVGAYNGSQAREVLVTVEQWESMSRQDSDEPSASKSPARASRGKPVSASSSSLRARRPAPDESPFDDDDEGSDLNSDDDDFSVDEPGSQDDDLDEHSYAGEDDEDAA